MDTSDGHISVNSPYRNFLIAPCSTAKKEIPEVHFECHLLFDDRFQIASTIELSRFEEPELMPELYQEVSTYSTISDILVVGICTS
jgi:hypothetical protein